MISNMTSPSNTTQSVLNQKKKTIIPLIVLATCILLANMIVFVLFARKRNLRTATNLFVLSLAIADSANGLVNIPVLLAILTKAIPTEPGGTVTRILHNLTLILTAYHILAITMEKYFAILKPFRHHTTVTKCLVLKVILVIWLSSGVLATAQLAVDETTNEECIYLVFYFVAVFVVPYAVMIYAYTAMFGSLHKRKQRTQNRPNCRVYKRVVTEWKCLAIFIVMLVVFLICWLPWFLFRMMLSFGYSQFVESSAFDTFIIIRYCSSILNPLLYSMLKGDFLKALKTCRKSKFRVERNMYSSTNSERKARLINTSHSFRVRNAVTMGGRLKTDKSVPTTDGSVLLQMVTAL